MSLLRHVTAFIQTMMDAVMPTRHAGHVLQALTTQHGSSNTVLVTNHLLLQPVQQVAQQNSAHVLSITLEPRLGEKTRPVQLQHQLQLKARGTRFQTAVSRFLLLANQAKKLNKRLVCKIKVAAKHTLVPAHVQILTASPYGALGN